MGNDIYFPCFAVLFYSFVFFCFLSLENHHTTDKMKNHSREEIAEMCFKNEMHGVLDWLRDNIQTDIGLCESVGGKRMMDIIMETRNIEAIEVMLDNSKHSWDDGDLDKVNRIVDSISTGESSLNETYNKAKRRKRDRSGCCCCQ